MPTVNFSVPEDIKRSFDETFAGQNKSAILSGLMERAVAEVEQRRRREQAAARLLKRRSGSQPVTAQAATRARRLGRP